MHWHCTFWQRVALFYHPLTRPFALCFLLTISAAAWSDTQVVAHPPANNLQQALILDILQLAIRKSGQGHLYSLSAQPEETDVQAEGTGAEQLAQLKNGELSVIWAGAHNQLDNSVSPIPIPILKGLLGHRIFIIRQENQELFDGINSLEELKKLPLGQARFSRDAAILKHANMTVIDPVKHANLFKMLEGGRFDYFPRAVHELWREVEDHQGLSLAIEENILLVYPYALNFFVSDENKTLRKHIESGFRTAIEDGSFDQLFFNHELVRNAFEKSNFKARKIFHLPNPNISASTYQRNSELWLNIENL